MANLNVRKTIIPKFVYSDFEDSLTKWHFISFESNNIAIMTCGTEIKNKNTIKKSVSKVSSLSICKCCLDKMNLNAKD